MTDQRIDALSPGTFELDGRDVEFAPGDTILRAATRAGHYIPHLCWKPEYGPPWLLPRVHGQGQWPHGRRVHRDGWCRSGSAKQYR